MVDLTLYDPFARMQFTGQHCFLCGRPVSADQTVPIFPDWLMNQYNFADQELLLLDKSVLTYRELTMPCCTLCHQQHLEPLERAIQAAAAQGLTGWRQLPEKQIYQWLGKMFYGVLVRELTAEQNPLVQPQYRLTDDYKMFGKLQSFFKVLQSLRVPMKFADFLPGSLFIVPVRPGTGDPAFAYRDDLHTMMFSLKLDDTWLIGCLLDNGIIKEALRPLWQPLHDQPLHPKQAAEFLAQVYYAAYLFNVVPEYFIRPVKPTDQELVVDTLIDDITASVFNPWQITGYAQMLEEMLKSWGITTAEILRNPQQPLSFLFDAAGNFRKDFDE